VKWKTKPTIAYRRITRLCASADNLIARNWGSPAVIFDLRMIPQITHNWSFLQRNLVEYGTVVVRYQRNYHAIPGMSSIAADEFVKYVDVIAPEVVTDTNRENAQV